MRVRQRRKRTKAEQRGMEKITGNSATKCQCQPCVYLRHHWELYTKTCLGFLAPVSNSQNFFGRTDPAIVFQHHQK